MCCYRVKREKFQQTAEIIANTKMLSLDASLHLTASIVRADFFSFQILDLFCARACGLCKNDFIPNTYCGSVGLVVLATISKHLATQ